MKIFLKDVQMYVLNHIVNHIPCQKLRLLCYRKTGMIIGENSKILMGCFVQSPENIVVGNNCCINEFCYLDGRGGLQIANNVSISMYSKILTGTHDSQSNSFEYKTKEVSIEDNVWVGMGAIVLPGTRLKHGCILAAGSVSIKNIEYEECGIYSGVPAKKIGVRKSKCRYKLGWKPRFR